MKAAIYNPYLDTLGGGERYTLTFAQVLTEIGYKVSIEWRDKGIIEKAQKRFGLDLKNIEVLPDIKKGDGLTVKIIELYAIVTMNLAVFGKSARPVEAKKYKVKKFNL